MAGNQRLRQLRKSDRTWDAPWLPLGAGVLGGALLALALPADPFPAFLFGCLALGLPAVMIQKAVQRVLRETRALVNIRPMVGDQLLSRDTWAVDAVYAENMLALVDDSGADQIVELGAGRSTLLIARRLEARGTGHVVAVEHLERFADRTREALREEGLGHRATVVHAPLTETSVDGREVPWYDMAALHAALPEGIQLLLVDGPPTHLGRDARWPALPLLADRLAPGATILMDDGDRRGETRAALDWHERLGGSIRYLPGGRGGWLLVIGDEETS